MPFTVTVTNAGVDGTITVVEHLNENERLTVFNDILSAGQSVQVTAQGDPPKDFEWVHMASNLTGGPDSKGDGDTISVSS
jgi:hypothetical protein